MAYNNGTLAISSECLPISEELWKAASEWLNQFQKEFDCSLESVYIPNPGHEEKLYNACVLEPSMTSCAKAIYEELASFEKEMEHAPPNILEAYNVLMQALKINKKPIEKASDKPSGSYSSQVSLCKRLHIFKQFTETINRCLYHQHSISKNL
ncbi:uncharacterized protein LOC143842587 [Paroedura picta]|uniref:uncharacterized protein LOC143842587 n=1 Tax=Paroedura picta TaxID=143630 RepID=UPI004057A9D6